MAWSCVGLLMVKVVSLVMVPKAYGRIFALVLLILPSSLSCAQDPGAFQDAEAERQKILRTADQVDLLSRQSDDFRTQIEALKKQMTDLEMDKTALENQLTQIKSEQAALRAALEKSEASRLKEREVLLTEVGKLMEGGKKKSTAPAVSLPPKEKSDATVSADVPTEKGFYHTVESGQSLWQIVEAFKAEGVIVTVDDIRKANHLDKKSSLKTGQKLFIPKK
jgi:LysM repeat protein